MGRADLVIDAARGQLGSRRRGARPMRRGMIVAQVALSLVLLNTGVLVVRSVEQLLRADPGFRSEGVFTVNVRTPPVFFPRPRPSVSRIGCRVRWPGFPASAGVSAASVLPLTARPRAVRRRAHPGTPAMPRGTRSCRLYRCSLGLFRDHGYSAARGPQLRHVRRVGAEAIIDTRRPALLPGVDPWARDPVRGTALTIVGVVHQARLYDLHRTAGRRCRSGR